MNDYNNNDLVLKLVDDFHVGRYASVTTKVVILHGPYLYETVNNFLKLVCWNQHKKFYISGSLKVFP